MNKEKGHIQIYTGNGKGKTTAAFGLALRAVGAGKKVYIAQFVKGQVYSEIKAVKKYLPNIEVKQFGLECFIVKEPTQADVDIANEGLTEVARIIKDGKHDLIILDEANIALYYDLYMVDQLVAVLKTKPAAMEIIITGRYAPQQLIDVADLVTEMTEVKHYYQNGVEAREGIEF